MSNRGWLLALLWAIGLSAPVVSRSAHAGVKFAARGGETQLAANYYECGACQEKSPLYANNSNGNTTYSVGTVNFLTYGYGILNVNVQMGVQEFGQPLAFTAGYARNLADDVQYDTAWSLGKAVTRR